MDYLSRNDICLGQVSIFIITHFSGFLSYFFHVIEILSTTLTPLYFIPKYIAPFFLNLIYFSLQVDNFLNFHIIFYSFTCQQAKYQRI